MNPLIVEDALVLLDDIRSLKGHIPSTTLGLLYEQIDVRLAFQNMENLKNLVCEPSVNEALLKERPIIKTPEVEFNPNFQEDFLSE